jgi:hypothetical protein
MNHLAFSTMRTLRQWKFRIGIWLAISELEQRVYAYEYAANEAADNRRFDDAHALTSMATALVELGRW